MLVAERKARQRREAEERQASPVVTPTKPKPQQPALTEEEFVSFLLSFVFEVTVTPENSNRYYLSDLAKEFTDKKALLGLSYVDSIIMEVVESKRAGSNPGIYSSYPSTNGAKLFSSYSTSSLVTIA